MALSLSPQTRDRLISLLICFSVGNLCFLRRWYDLEHLQERSMDYYRTGPADQNLLWATIFCAVMLTAALWLGWMWVEWKPTKFKLQLARCSFLLLLMFSLESVRRYWIEDLGRVDTGSNVSILTVEGIIAVGLGMMLFGNFRILHAARRVAIMLTLLFPVLLVDFAFGRFNGEPPAAYQPTPLLPALPLQSGSRRVIWLLFDEFDQRLAFDARQPSVNLPELDRLRSESFVANRVSQTAAWTMVALPSLLSGRIFARADLIEASGLRLYPDGSGEGLDWRKQPNVFKKARDLGANPQLIGWHHPYCRVFRDSLVHCFDIPGGHPATALLRELSATAEGVPKTILYLFRLQLANLTDVLRTDGVSTSEQLRSAFVQRRQQRQYFEIRDRAYAAAVDRQINFLMVHFPTPHLFGIYDRKRRDFKLSSSLDYFDNLALVDRTVGELRRTLERAGLWKDSNILVSSDHGLRPELWRGGYSWTPELDRLTADGPSETVPFIVKLAGENQPLVYDRSFSGVLTGELTLAILSGQVTTPAEIAAWLDHYSAVLAKSVR